LVALIAPTESPVRELPDLVGRTLGIAGGPLDKSWLILRAYAMRRYGIDLNARTNKNFGPPPLLAEQMKAGRLDALLTFWPYAAKAEAAGARRVLAVEDAVIGLGIDAGVPISVMFSQGWAEKNPAAIAGFIAASRSARAILARRIRMATYQTGDRGRTITTGTAARLGTGARQSMGAAERESERLFALMVEAGGADLVDPHAFYRPEFWPVTR
jgi:NitT/TauT family transport system substrate-binding protein